MLRTEPSSAPSEVGVIRKRPVPSLSEAAIWQVVGKGWRQLHGGYFETGASIESHDFQLKHRFEWSRSFHPDSLEVCLNLAGHGMIRCGEDVLKIAPLTAAFYLPGSQSLQAWREPSQRHRFITVEFSVAFLQRRLNSCDGALHPLVERFVQGHSLNARFGQLHRLTAAQEQIAKCLLNPPVPQGARGLWYEAKLLELIAGFLFERGGADELFCDRQKRLARERVERVVMLLEQNLVEPLSLEEIGRRVGCSPFHLSRTFSAEMGTTIPQYLRRLSTPLHKFAHVFSSGQGNWL